MFSQPKSNADDFSHFLNNAIYNLGLTLADMRKFNDAYKAPEQTFFYTQDPNTHQQFTCTYGALREGIKAHERRVEILQSMLNKESITQKDHDLIMKLPILAKNQEIRDYPIFNNTALKP